MIITDVYERSEALLASQFREHLPDGNLTNLQKLIYAICQSAQNIQNVEQELLHFRSLGSNEDPSAVGVQLDGIGQIVGLARTDGQSDEDYREALQFQIYINVSNATPEEMIFIAANLTDSTQVRYIEVYPAAFQVVVNGPIRDDDENLLWLAPPNESVQAMQSVSPAGVNFIGITTTQGVEKPFAFSSDPITEPLYVTDPTNPLILDPFEVDPGTGATQLYVQRGETVDPFIGGGFAEYGTPIDTTGAGQLAEVVVLNGNLPQ